MNTRGREGQPYCQFCRPQDAVDPVEAVVREVAAIDPGLTPEVVAGAVREAAWQEGQRRQLAWALQDRPALLTGDGAASPAVAVLRLIDALAEAGATMIVKPACPRCGTVKPLTARQEEMRICARCYARARALVCGPLTAAGWRRWRQGWPALPGQVIPAVAGPDQVVRSGIDGLRYLAA